MKPSKYLSRFHEIPDLSLIGDCLLVERVAVEERKTASGLILNAGRGESSRSQVSSDLPTFVHVLAVGKGYYDDDTKEDVPLDVKPGDIILVGNHSVRWFSDMDISDYTQYEIGLTREQEITLKFSGKEDYDRTFAQLAPRTVTQGETNER